MDGPPDSFLVPPGLATAGTRVETLGAWALGDPSAAIRNQKLRTEHFGHRYERSDRTLRSGLLATLLGAFLQLATRSYERHKGIATSNKGFDRYERSKKLHLVTSFGYLDFAF